MELPPCWWVHVALMCPAEVSVALLQACGEFLCSLVCVCRLRQVIFIQQSC